MGHTLKAGTAIFPGGPEQQPEVLERNIEVTPTFKNEEGIYFDIGTKHYFAYLAVITSMANNG